MDFEFDKEMDALLRQTARGESAFAAENPKSKIQNLKSLHLDADEISAFAEDALPEKTKLKFTAHFADCDRCRKILSNVILINAEATSEIVHAPQTEKVAAVLPWHRRFFAAPALAYSLGALVLIFGGLIALTFLQSGKNAQNTEVSQSREVPVNMQGASSEGETRTIEPNAAASNSASMMSNYSANSNTAMTNSAPANPSSPNRAAGSMSNAASVSNSATVAGKPAESKKETAKTQPVAEDKTVSEEKNTNENQASGAGVLERQNVSENDDKKTTSQSTDMAMTLSPPPAPKLAAPSMASRSADGVKAKSARKTDAEKSENRQIGGKTFRRSGGVWYDASYSGQSTTNIGRGTTDFKNLDSGLRTIANALSGTIVVVYKGKVYRIQ
jgi:hypothetical protein